ncbi:MAG: hypothetical protein F6K10_16245 [Moorea sp. SIO2B7]|nr:hypothetical protein [Moorena sp. SIO2B7]
MTKVSNLDGASHSFLPSAFCFLLPAIQSEIENVGDNKTECNPKNFCSIGASGWTGKVC